MTLQVIFRAGRLAMPISLAAAMLAVAGAPSPAAAMERATAPAPQARSVLPAQAPSAAAPAQPLEANIAQLHQRLQITAAQQPKFDALVNIMRENARMTASPPPANPSAVDDLRLAIRGGEQELAALKRLLPPMQELYASLSPAQQKAADQLFRQGPGE